MIAIIGAGISGLTLAYHLKKKGISYQLFEASDRAGGYIWSERKGDYLLEYGPNSLLADEDLMALVHELGLQEEVQPAEDMNKNRFVFRNGRYQKLPSSPPALLFNPFFSWQTKWAILRELSYKGQGPAQESIASFFQRHFTQELVDYAVDPFVSGIYAGNPHKLLVGKTFARVVEMEQEYGSIIRGFMKQGGKAKRKYTFSFKNGVQTLPEALAKAVEIKWRTAVNSIEKHDAGFWLQTSEGKVEASQVVLALPTFKASPMLKQAYPAWAEALGHVYYPPMCAVHTAFNRSNVGHKLDGFGGLNPSVEKQFAAGSIWSSSIFPDRAPKGQVLLTSFVGGARKPNYAQLSDQEIQERLTKELQKAYQISGKPVFQQVCRWERAIPQYDQHILAAHANAELAEKDGLWVCANWLGGVSIPDCVKKAKALAEQLGSNKKA